MANITLGGNPISTIGSLPKTGEKAPEFNLTAVDLSHKSLVDYAGKNIVLNILLIPFIGMLGAALALIISKIFIAVSSYYVMKKNYKYGINALNVAR